MRVEPPFLPEPSWVEPSFDAAARALAENPPAHPPSPERQAALMLLGHVHLQDVDGHLDRHWPPGMGTVNWQALFAALSTLDHQPRLLLELREPARIPQAMRYLGGLDLACYTAVVLKTGVFHSRFVKK